MRAGSQRVLRDLAILGAVMVAGAVGIASSAWACVPQPFISLSPRSSGPPGSEVKVEGVNFTGQVEIRWNGVGGAKMGEVEAGEGFETPVKIPVAPPGLYTLIALTRSPGGAVRDLTRAPFLVTGREGPEHVVSSSKRSRGVTARWELVAAGAVLLAVGAAGGAALPALRRRRRM